MSQLIATRIRDERARRDISQRALGAESGISQPTLQRIESGERAPKMNELLSIAWALGTTIGALTGNSPVRERLDFAARAGRDDAMDQMRDEFSFYFELDAYLDDFGVPRRA